MKKLLILGIIILVMYFVGNIWWNNGIQAVNRPDHSTKLFVIRQGGGIRTIANQLKQQGLIKDPVVFFLLIKQLGLDGKIQAGDFRLSPSMTASDIVEQLTHGTLDIWITIPEGKRAEEIAEILKNNIPSYQSVWRKKLQENEGYLFPDTYLFPKDTDIDLIISIMKKNFESKIANIKQKKNNKLSNSDIIILASIVEREAKYANDRPLVASVYINRINIGILLQADATIQYALGFQVQEKTWWKKNLTKSDLAFNSSYNTYINPGLPPAPISNPGLLALESVFNPSDTDYLYYISDSSGHNHYAKTLEEHNVNIRRYGL